MTFMDLGNVAQEIRCAIMFCDEDAFHIRQMLKQAHAAHVNVLLAEFEVVAARVLVVCANSSNDLWQR